MPEQLNQPWWIDAIKALLVVNLVLSAFAYATWLERKLLGRMQLRYGPNRVGPVRPAAADRRPRQAPPQGRASTRRGGRLLYLAAPAVAVFTALAAFSVIPFGGVWHWGEYDVTGWVVDVSIGLVLIFSLGAIGIYAFLVGGWSSDSKYSLLGSMRTSAQLVSYEVSLALSVLGVVIMATRSRSSRSPWSSRRRSGSSPRSSSASSSSSSRASPRRTGAPFDLPEAEQELVAGYHTEYTGMRFGLFPMAEYINMITLSGLAVTLFFGGWGGPFLPGPVWFLLKLAAFIFLFMWLRATLPRLATTSS